MPSTILIVGASSGIGKETALTFAKNNWKVVVCSRNLKKLKDFEDFSSKNLKKILPFKLDITKSNKLNSDINKIIREIIGIPDIVFLNAGTNNPNSKDIVNNKQTKKLFETNFLELFIVQKFSCLI